jgi:hypothetical protein
MTETAAPKVPVTVDSSSGCASNHRQEDNVSDAASEDVVRAPSKVKIRKQKKARCARQAAVAKAAAEDVDLIQMKDDVVDGEGVASYNPFTVPNVDKNPFRQHTISASANPNALSIDTNVDVIPQSIAGNPFGSTSPAAGSMSPKKGKPPPPPRSSSPGCSLHLSSISPGHRNGNGNNLEASALLGSKTSPGSRQNDSKVKRRTQVFAIH